MKKSLLWILLGLALLPVLICTAKTQTWWVSRWSTPSAIVENVAKKANEGATEIQDVKPNAITNKVTGTAGTPSPWAKYQISNTFIWLATSEFGVAPYIQWTLYIGLVWASILLIWNWFLLVTGRKPTEAKENIKYILIWVVLMTWFYAVIAIVTAVINYFFAS
jgi:hypothetical protein